MPFPSFHQLPSLHEPRHWGTRDDPAFYTRKYVAIPLLLTSKLDDMRGLRWKRHAKVWGIAIAALHFLSGDCPDVPIDLIEVSIPHRMAPKTGQHEQSQRQLREGPVIQWLIESWRFSPFYPVKQSGMALCSPRDNFQRRSCECWLAYLMIINLKT